MPYENKKITIGDLTEEKPSDETTDTVNTEDASVEPVEEKVEKAKPEAPAKATKASKKKYLSQINLKGCLKGEEYTGPYVDDLLAKGYIKEI